MFQWQFDYAFHSLKKKKGRTIFAIIAICLSVGIIVTSNGAVDNLGNNFVNSTFTNFPAVDVVIKHSDNSLITNVSTLDNSISAPHLEGFSPRLQTDGALFYEDNQYDEISHSVMIIGLNITKENSLGIGSFFPYIDNLPINQCLLLGPLGSQVSSSGNGSLVLRLYLSETNNVNVTISNSTSVQQIKKFPSSTKNIVVVNIATFYQFLPNDSASELVSIFDDHNTLYSVSNIDSTVNDIKNRVISIQNELGYDYNVQVPIAQALANVQSSLSGSSLLLNLISFLMMFISIILIYSLVSSSIDEKIHEYGIFRAIGISRISIFFQTIIQGLILSLIGTGAGLILGLILLTLLLPTFSLQNTSIMSYVNLMTTAFLVGIGVTTIASILPAVRSTKSQILNALELSRTESSEYQARVISYRTKMISWNNVFWGLFLSMAGILAFVIFPAINHFFDQSTSNSLFFLIVAFLFIGFILICLGFFGPLLEKFLVLVFSLFSKEKSFVVRLFLRKNRRRNLPTIMIYAIAFSFIFFLTINMGMYYETQIYILKRDTGSDYQVFSNDPHANYLLNDNILNYTRHYASVSSSFVTIPSISSITGCNLKVSDQIKFKTVQPSVYGTEGSLLQSLFTNYEFIPGSNFTQIDENNTVVISSSLAKALDLNIGDFLRVEISSSVQSIKDRFKKDYSVKIVGIVLRMPGFVDVTDQNEFTSQSAIFVGENTWSTFVKDNQNPNDIALDMHDYISKIFIKKSSSEEINFKNDLFLQFGTKIGIIDYQVELSEWETSSITGINLIMLILSLTIALTLFAVFSATTASIIESQKDIGLLKTLGLNNKDVAKLFILESFIIGLSASFIGSITGYIVEYMQAFNSSFYYNAPLFIIYPPLTVIVTYVMTLLFAYLGSKLPTKRISKFNISEIFR
jgi:ABC-type lipoprotein release transport system permease subunit